MLGFVCAHVHAHAAGSGTQGFVHTRQVLYLSKNANNALKFPCQLPVAPLESSPRGQMTPSLFKISWASMEVTLE